MAGIPCALMRGGTSKGGVFLAADLPAEPAERDALLLRVMGSPDVRQIDGLGGAHPLTSKVAVVSPSADDEADVDYLFLQVVVDAAVVSGSQTCGNMLAAVGPFAVLRGLVPATDGVTDVRVRLVNTGALAVLRVQTPGGVVTFAGDTEITGVPGTAAPVEIVAVPSATPLLPTGRARQVLAGLEATCIDNGMPSVLVRAADLGLAGTEEPAVLEADPALRARVDAVRAEAAAAMGLSTDLAATTVPKIVLVSGPKGGGSLTTRSFIPERVHQAIGVLGAATVAAAVRLPGSVAADVAVAPAAGEPVRVEHPSGFLDVDARLGEAGEVLSTSVLRTARLILDGTVYPGPDRATSENSQNTQTSPAGSAPAA
ncbi:PrpF domain-containing protein [Nocardioides sp. GY 10127]|uniref:PrpF domain-containing protein n=1 Tax=Nocardioides sp. GY 10127 TaxID=2569762 RepID=UPI0010A91B78|nr:PrpF domain-containing protein [Nocardioides sp. GY 10127]TIC82679.1 4-oxalomesaconate tautomerase [Nocardioides sp. GY 10127]